MLRASTTHAGLNRVSARTCGRFLLTAQARSPYSHGSARPKRVPTFPVPARHRGICVSTLETFSMLVIPGGVSRDLCAGLTRRELLRVGGSASMGLSLAEMMQLQEACAATIDKAATKFTGPAGWGRARGGGRGGGRGGPS